PHCARRSHTTLPMPPLPPITIATPSAGNSAKNPTRSLLACCFSIWYLLSRRTGVMFVPQATPQDFLLHFPGGCHRQFVHEDDPRRNLESGDPSVEGVDDLLLGRTPFCGTDHERHRHLLEAVVLLAHHRRGTHPRDAAKQFLDLGRRDVLPADLQHVLVACEVSQVAVLPEDSRVARAEPALCVHRSRGSLGVLVISDQARIATHLDLADLARRQHFSGFHIDDADVHARFRPAAALAALSKRRTRGR